MVAIIIAVIWSYLYRCSVILPVCPLSWIISFDDLLILLILGVFSSSLNMHIHIFIRLLSCLRRCLKVCDKDVSFESYKILKKRIILASFAGIAARNALSIS